MIDQVAAVHKKYGMPFFHMGGDEAFQVVCSQFLSLTVEFSVVGPMLK